VDGVVYKSIAGAFVQLTMVRASGNVRPVVDAIIAVTVARRIIERSLSARRERDADRSRDRSSMLRAC